MVLDRRFRWFLFGRPWWVLYCLLAWVATWNSACGGGSAAGTPTSGTQPPPSPQDVAVQMSPEQAQVGLGKTLQFTATVTGTSDNSVVWQVNGVGGGSSTVGTISAGLYTAPTAIPKGPISVEAISAAKNSVSASASITLLPIAVTPPPSITSISPQAATVGDQITVTGQNLYDATYAVFVNAIGQPLTVTTNGFTETSATYTVPQGAVTGQFYVRALQGNAWVPSNTLQFQRLARLRIRAPQNDVAAGESLQFQYALLGDPTYQTVTFTADQGSFSGSTYLAPSSVSSDTFAHITGCITGTQSCDTFLLGLHSFRISPIVPLVSLGNALQLSTVGAANGLNWDLINGAGSLQSGGLYAAGTTTLSGGPALVSATSSTNTEQTSIGVTGAFPGLLNRIYDYVDETTQALKGTYTMGLAVSGNRLYVSAENELGFWSNSYFWIDVYDITNPLYPVWLTAVESNSSGPIYSYGQYLYSFTSTEFVVPGVQNTITLYSIASGVPVLLAQDDNVDIPFHSEYQGVLVTNPGPSGALTLYNVTGGTITATSAQITLPSDANTFSPFAVLAVGNLLFVSIERNDNLGPYILTYNLSTSPATLVSTVDGGSLGFYASGNLLFAAYGGMNIYDISTGAPVQAGYVDGIIAQELSGNQLLAISEASGCQIVDVSNPQSPAVTAILFDGVPNECSDGVFVGTYVYAWEGDGGILIYDASQTGGPIPQDWLDGGPVLSGAAYDQLLVGNNLLVANSTAAGAALDIYDTTVSPPSLTGQYIDGTQEGNAVQSAGNYVYFGMTNNIGVLDVSQPSNPSLAYTVPVPAISLAEAGNTLFAGTTNKSIVVSDITNPAQPHTVNTLALTDLPVKIRVSGSLMFVADNAAGLLIYDITSPQSPVLLSNVTGFPYVTDVAIQGTTAFLAADVDGLVVVNISSPSQPTVLSTTGLSRADPFYNIAPLNEALSIAVDNGIVYVGTLNDDGLVFGFDCTNLNSPRIVSVYAYFASWIGTLLPTGNELYVGGDLDFASSVIQVDISNPYDSINQYFPPAALQSPSPLPANRISGRKKHAARKFDKRFHRG
jgi:hypothetical protein